MSQIFVHFRPSTETANVRCLNGSAHVSETFDINLVTCPLCLNPNTNVEFWYKNGQLKSFKQRGNISFNDEQLMRNRESK